ncbi:ribosome biogenesis GTPase YlqF [Echinimonas agarilytica]|uniref:Ribosome biogenesis GTPase A n=1 Tax=Echinimonas agarilytica TaxID=1215918 RepID=A0AA41W806_9GAMM|nr:ribosome biogenesis GTPase YlqF [Echinimonas agarilytica]MCM2680645.1 ribosome biogenesis GTPase YlqF [Echinimonas agarilytica]
MAINWYPGHMHKAQKEIKDIISDIDLIIEVLDARIPNSSENPMIAQLRGEKPCIKILNKSDLADADTTALWIEHFKSHKNTDALAVTAKTQESLQKIIPRCKDIVVRDVEEGKPMRVLIAGIPNVGKSTIINALAKRIVAKTGNEPAVTKSQQRINIGSGITLFDTPGMLWPKIHSEDSGYRLAVTGAIKETAFELDDVASYLADYLVVSYPEQLKTRYELEELAPSGYEILEDIGRKRGCLRSGGRVEINKAAKILLTELRETVLGRISMETPQMCMAEQLAIDKKLAAKAEKDAARKKKSKGRKR